ncbi:MAG: hypothetical protein IJ077_08590 [Eubacterium sp.]|nr:hypothetical protein [Alphaproteobacteria bacterium]MBQ8981650.1 hypothetical protein [Eubacterium sp.]
MTLDEMIKEAEREVALRKKCYPQWVQTGKIKQLDANYRIEVMEWIVDTLKDLKEFQNKINTRFDKDLLK